MVIKKKTSKFNRVLAWLLIVCVITGALFIYKDPMNVFAVFKESDGVKYSEYIKDHTIEDGTLFIGTYLIHLDALNDQNMEKAKESQEQSAQYAMYYKSELAAGSWRATDSADNLSALTDSGVIVTDDDLKDLIITFSIDKNGVVTDVKKDEKVSLFDNPDPYDIRNYTEFSNLKDYYEGMYSKDSKGEAAFLYAMLTDFWETDVHTDVSDACDRRLAALQPVYESLKASGEDEAADNLYAIMDRLDATRRAEVYGLLLNSDYHYLDADSGEDNSDNSNMGDYEEGAAPSRFAVLISAVLGENYNTWTYDNKHFKMSDFVQYLADGHDKAKEDAEKEKEDADSDDDESVDGDSLDGDDEEGGDEEGGDDEGDEGDDEEESDDVLNLFQLKWLSYDTPYENGTFDKEDFSINKDLLDLIYSAQEEAEDKYQEYLNKALYDPETVIGTAEYTRMQSIFDNAEAGLTGDLIQNLNDLQLIFNIADGNLIKPDDELAIIDGELLDSASSKFSSKSSAGVSDRYDTLMAQNASAAVGDNAVEDQQSELSSVKGELEFIISEKIKRMTNADALAFTYGRIDWTEQLKGSVLEDAFKTAATDVLEEHIQWLKQKAEAIIASDEDLQSDMDKLQEQKDELNEQREEALDNNDLNLAGKIDAKIDAIDDAIAKEQEKQQSIIDDPNASASEKAAAGDALGQTADGLIDKLKDTALDGLSNGDGAGAALDALGAMGAVDALKDIADSAGDGLDSAAKNALDAAMDTAQQVADAGQALGSGGKEGDGSGADGYLNLSADDILGIIEDMLGGPFDELSPEGKIIAAVGVNWLGQEGNKAAKGLAAKFINICANEHNKYVFKTMIEPSAGELGSLRTVGDVAGYRYVFDDIRSNVELTKGGQIFRYKVNSKILYINGEESKMGFVAKKNGKDVYISEAVISSYFKLAVEPIDEADYSAMVTTDMTKKAKELLKAFKEA